MPGVDEIDIVTYTKSNHNDMLRLLSELHGTYFAENTTLEIQEVSIENNSACTYEHYLNIIETNTGNDWIIFVAKTSLNRITGFIIGSIEIDNTLVLSKIGKVEDWYVETECRSMGIGSKLFNHLEKYFKERGCSQVQSETWQGFDLSRQAHLRSGFFISGISFRKKL